MAKKIEFQVGFNVRKEELNDIYSLLKGIQQQAEKGSSMGNLTPQLQQAAVEAKKLENILNKAWNSKLNQMDLSKVTTSINTTYGSIDRMRQKLESLGQGRVFNKLQSDLLATNMQLKQSNKFLDNMAQTMANTVRFGLSSSIVNRVSNEIQRAYDYSIKLNTSLTDIRIVSDKSADDMERFAIQANKAAKALGSSTLDYTKASTIYYQQGLSDEDVAARAETTLKAANVTGQTGEEVSEQLTSIWNGYKVSAEEAELYIDKVAKVAAGTAADLEELATGMSKVASAANLMGIDIDQLNAMMSTMISVTRESPETIGTAMRNILARMGQLQSDGEDEFGVTLTKVTQQMSDMGIQILDENNNIRNMGTILDEVAEKWNSWSKAQQMAAAKVMAGTQNYSRFVTLMDNQNMWQSALEMSRNATGELDRENQIYLESTEAHLQQLATTAEETYATLFDTDVINDFTDSLTGALTIFNNFLKTTGGGLSSLTNLGLILGNVFSRQIGAGIGQMLTNRDLGNLNEQNAQAALDLANQNVSQAGSQNEIDVYEREVAYSERLLGLAKNLSTERFNELNTLKHSLAQDELRMAAIYDYEEATKDSNQTLASITTKLNAQKQATQAIQKEATKLVPAFKQLELYIQEGYDTEVDVNNALDLQVDILDATERLMKQQLLDREQSLVVQKMLRDFENGDLSEEETLRLQEMINKALERQLNIERQIKHEKEMQEAIDSGEKAELEQRINQNQNKLDQGLSGDERTALIQDALRGGTAILSMLQQISGIVGTIFDDSLSGGEKLSRIGSTLLFTLSTIAFNFRDIKAFLPAVIQLFTGMTAAEYSAAKAAGKLGASIWSALAPILPIILAIVAAIGLVVAAGIGLYNEYNRDAKAAEDAAKQAQVLTERYNELKESANELKTAISEYDDAIKALDDLKEGTDEYSEALKTANEKAKELIETYKLYDSYKMNDKGIIEIDPDTLDKAKKQADDTVRDAETQMYAAKLTSDKANLTKSTTDLRRKIGNVLYTDKNGQRLQGTQYTSSEGAQLSNESIEAIVSSLQKLRDSNEAEYEKLKTGEKSIQDFVKNMDNTNPAINAMAAAIDREKDSLFALVTATDKQTEAANYYAQQILSNEVEKKYGEKIKSIATDKEGKTNDALYNKVLEVATNQAKGIEGEMAKEIAGINVDAASSNSKLNKNFKGEEVKNDESLARIYAKEVLNKTQEEVDKMTYKGGTNKGTLKDETGKEVISEVSDDVMRHEIARVRKTKEITDRYSGQLNQDDFLKNINNMIKSVGTANKEYGIDFSQAIMNGMLSDNKEIDLSDQFANLSPEEILNLDNMDKDTLIKELGLSEEQIKELGFADGEAFYNSFDNALDKYDSMPFFEKSKINAENAGILLGDLSKGNIDEVLKDKDKSAMLSNLEGQYSELAEIQDKTSHEYLSLLREIKEQEESNAAAALKWEKEKQEEKIKTQIDELDKLKELYDNEEDESKKHEIEAKIVAKTDEVEKALEELQNTNYEIKMQIDADLASDVEDAFGIAEELGQLKDYVSDDLTYTFEEAQALIDKGYGEMFTNAKETAENTIQVNKDVMNSFIDDKQAEINADREAKIAQLENQKTLLQAQRQALVNKLSALQEAASAETAVDAATAMEKVNNANSEYEAATKALNQSLQDEASGATESQNINAELFNALGGMYEQDAENENQAEADATNNQQANINARIANVHQLHQAYSNLARQVKASESGQEIPLGNESAGAGGVNTGVTGSTEVKGNTQEANQIDITDLKNKTQDLFNNNKDQYDKTIQALIKSTQAEINNIDAQIGAADAGIAALKSANRTLDKAQNDARVGGSKGSGSGEKEKDPDKMDAIENEKDRYHDVNIELKQIETELGRIQKQKDKLLGQDLIDNLNKQLNLLNKQMDKTNEKISIAKDEAGELRSKLSSQGISFNNDGTIANYTQAYEAQLSYVNALVAKYNSMSAKEQEGFKETVEQAKKDFEAFTDNMEKYDELISDTIPGLQDEIQDAVDQQIEIQIEKFNMEIEIRLDLKEAELEWNEFKKKIIDGIKDDNILGSANARLQDYNAYYKNDNTGIIQRNTEHINAIRNELLEMDRTGWSEVYGDNRAQALEDLQTYYQQMMEDLQEIEEIQEDIHDSYLDMIDEAQEGFDKQLETYEQISSLIEHDMKLIELVYGEENYEAQANYYQKQDENYRKQLEFQRVQKDFWWEQMQAMEEGSEEWKAAKENWMSAVDDWKSSLNDAIENITDKYLNSINLIFQKLNDQVTSGKGLDYVNEQWELINQNADQYLDTINSMYGIQQLENKYLDAIDQTDSISAQRKLNDLMKEEVAALEKKDKLTQYDIDRANMKYEIALKQIALEEAQQNKSTMRLRRDSQGNYSYQFVSDEDSIAKTREELQALYNELYNFDLSAYRENLDQLLSVWTEYQEKMAEAAQINDPVKRAEKEALIQEQYGQLINGIVAENEVLRTNLHESAFTELADLYNVDVENFQNMTDAEKEILMSDMIPQWTSGVQQMADVFADEDEGFIGVCKKAMEDLADTTEEYMSDLEDLEDIAGVTYDEITEGTDDTIDKTETLLEDNQELIDKYGEQLEAIRKIIIELNSLISKYNSAKQAAMEATEAAYKYWQEQKRQEAEAAAKEQAKSTSNNNNNNSNNSSSSSGRSGTSSGGDGVPRVGDICTYIGGTYYYDSYGTSPSGNRGPGKQVTITQVKTDGRPYPIHVQSSNSAYGWLKKEQLSGYDTGGYTGNWGDNSGRLALLHQKELVLNADDTPNLLKAVSIMRNITNSIGSNILAQMAGVKAPTGQVAASSDTIEQIVQIDANFPNVQSSDEIKTAINDLVNRAAQRVHRKR